MLFDKRIALDHYRQKNLNPVFHYGYEAFFERCQGVGIDGIIIPDLPFEEKEEVDVVAGNYGIDLISMIAPTSKERIRKIAKGAKGFLYVVSSMGVTGERTNITTDIDGMLKEIRSVSSVPAAVGFGIHTPDQASEMGRRVKKIFSIRKNGVIIFSNSIQNSKTDAGKRRTRRMGARSKECGQDGKKESGLGKSRIRLYDNRLPLCGKLQKWCLG